MRHRDFELESAIKSIEEYQCESCGGYKVEDYCKRCEYRIALDVLQDEIKRERKRK